MQETRLAPLPPLGPDRLGGELPDALFASGGHALAYSTLQDGLNCWTCADGYVAYESLTVWGKRHWLVLSDPVCDSQATERVVEGFLSHAGRSPEAPECSFWQVHDHVAKVLTRNGYFTNLIGHEVGINLQYVGRRPWAWTRRHVRQAKRAGVVFQEVVDWGDHWPGVKSVSDDWIRRRGRHGRELRFLTRPLVSRLEPGVRRWIALADQEVVAFAVFDPMFSKSKPRSYYAQTLRSVENGDAWRSALINTAAEVFRSEGAHTLQMGWCPCAVARTEPAKRWSVAIRLANRVLYRFGGRLYNFQGLRSHKHRYLGTVDQSNEPTQEAQPSRGSISNVYLGANSRAPVGALLALLKAMRIARPPQQR